MSRICNGIDCACVKTSARGGNEKKIMLHTPIRFISHYIIITLIFGLIHPFA